MQVFGEPAELATRARAVDPRLTRILVARAVSHPDLPMAMRIFVQVFGEPVELAVDPGTQAGGPMPG